MSTLFLLNQTSEAAQVPAGSLIAVWDRGSVPEDQLSIPVELSRRLVRIREELAAWTYETGCVRIHGRLLEEYLRAGDTLSMWWCSTLVEKHPKVTRNLFAALKLRALELVLEERHVTELVLVTPRKTSGESALLRSVLGTFCAETKRIFRVECVEEKEVRSKVGLKAALSALYYRLPAPLKACVRLPVWWWLVRRRLPRTALARPVVGEGQFPASIVTYFPNIDMVAAKEGRFRSRYWESLHDALQPAPGKPHRINWVFLYFAAPQCSFRQALVLRNRFREKQEDGASFHFLEEFLTAGDIRHGLFRFVRLLVSSLHIESEARKVFRFSGSRMDLWPVLRENWADSTRGWRALERCFMREAFRRYAQWAGPQEWTIFPQENCPWERMLAQAIHEADAGPVYGAQHSTVRPTDFRYFDDPRMINDPSCRKAMLELWLCNGTGARDALLAAEMPPDRMAVVEALRYLYLGREEPSASLEERTSSRLLVVTSFFADETEAHLRTLAAAAAAGVLAGWEVIVKPHPYLPVEQRLRQLFAGSEPPRIVDGAIGCFLEPGTVVWASNSTTVALEAAFRRLSVLVQAAEDDVDLCPLQGLPGVVTVRTVEDVAAALAHPIAPDLPPDYLALDPALPRWRALLGLKR